MIKNIYRRYYKCPHCEEKAFYVLKDHKVGELINWSNFKLLNGEYPKPNEMIKCGTCQCPITQLRVENIVLGNINNGKK